MRVKGNTDFMQNQLLNAVVHKLTGSPPSPVEGQIYYDSGKQSVYIYSGSSWIPL